MFLVGLQGGGSYNLSNLSDRVAFVESNENEMSARFDGLASEVTLLRSKLDKCVTSLMQKQQEHYASMLKLFSCNSTRRVGTITMSCRADGGADTESRLHTYGKYR